jgi:hypothetical protein
MKIYLVLLLTCISAIHSFNSLKFKKPIDYRFENGEDGYISFFSENISYLITALENGIAGNSITRISINPTGKIDSSATINPNDSLVDSEVLRVIDLSKSLWKKCDAVNHDQVF